MPLPNPGEHTRGIEIHTQGFIQKEGADFRLNVWDFSGQKIYHAMHLFLPTRSSLYILVDDTREDHTSVRDKEFKYWLEMVEVFSAKSPVLIFQNERGGRIKKIDEAGIKARFPNVLKTFRGDLDRKEAAERLRRAIEYYIQELPDIGNAVPSKWVSIRTAIDEVALKKPYISLHEYFGICRRHQESDREKALRLSSYLHDIGVLLHFQDDPRLQKTVILQNRWVTEAVFRILDDESIRERFGRFTLDDCARLWSTPEYTEMHLELLALMEKLELCYWLPNARPDTWLVPQLLAPSTPKYVEGWPAPGDLVLVYRYDFLPRGLLSRLMVRMNRFVAYPEESWMNGSLFEHHETKLLARATERGDEIVLSAKGPESRALLSVIAGELDALNAGFTGLNDKVGKWVPCVCRRCSSATTPEVFEERRLLQRKRDNRLIVECPESYEDVSVLELMEGLRLEQLPRWAKEQQPSGGSAKLVKMFLASSKELKKDCDEFEQYFRQQNDSLRKQGLYLEIVRFEYFLDAALKANRRDEYNAAVRNADIFVSLFKTKTGKFTEEAFDFAHQAFKNTGKPRILAFFKKARVSTDAKSLAALKILVKFQKKLERFGHFYKTYRNADHLRDLFMTQLEKLEKEGEI